MEKLRSQGVRVRLFLRVQRHGDMNGLQRTSPGEHGGRCFDSCGNRSQQAGDGPSAVKHRTWNPILELPDNSRTRVMLELA